MKTGSHRERGKPALHQICRRRLLCRQPAELSANLARLTESATAQTELPKDMIDYYYQTRSEGFGDEIKRRIMIGTYVLSAGYYDAYYRKAQKVRTLIIQDFENAFKEVDVLMAPVSPFPAFKIGAKKDDPLAMYLADVSTIPTAAPAYRPSVFHADLLPEGGKIAGRFADHRPPVQ
jgi:aspartyl-tRNA(Asn)/glutamyl-tRNA(Gln) amidotransferase subunit A